MRIRRIPLFALALVVALPAQAERERQKQQKESKGARSEQGRERPKKGKPPVEDPEDRKLRRTAEAMKATEQRLAKLLRAGKIKGVDQVLPFVKIDSWAYQDGLKGIPEDVRALDGKKVMMMGFMLPIDEVENIREFLLVKSLWACHFGQPPDINGTVRVVWKGKKGLDYQFDPIKLVGKFTVKPTILGGFCVDIYQLETSELEVIELK